ncbi:hypothetical protein E2C01_038706 [Portunus trituberculatus]|uniref:Uncharacterized protein n=1 Tax=Portunus trituberculatus TaxID=210409 RepID=A0A5B7FIR2_PORTR|nr:hypothetical protein [Portunus trituberculatus]
MLELVREKNTSGTPEMNYTYSNKSLRKSSFDEIAATPRTVSFSAGDVSTGIFFSVDFRYAKRTTTAPASSLDAGRHIDR